MQKTIKIPKPTLTNPSIVKIWSDDVPNAVLSKKVCSKEYSLGESCAMRSKKIAIEIKTPRDISSYALLGCEFTSTLGNNLMVNFLSQECTKQYSETIAFDKSIVYVGLENEYVDAILATMDVFAKDNILGSGNLDFNIAACSKVGSSISIFKCITELLLQLVFEDIDLDEDDKISTLIQDNFKKFKI